MSASPIIISYFTANGQDWAEAFNTPYNRHYVADVKRIPTAHYDPEEKSWCCSAKYGELLVDAVKSHFPNLPTQIQEHREKHESYEQSSRNQTERRDGDFLFSDVIEEYKDKSRKESFERD